MDYKKIENFKDKLERIYLEENHNLNSDKLIKQSQKVDGLIIKELEEQIQSRSK